MNERGKRLRLLKFFSRDDAEVQDKIRNPVGQARQDNDLETDRTPWAAVCVVQEFVAESRAKYC